MSSKITDLGALTGASAANDDLVPVVDVSDTTMAASGTNKKMTMSELSSKLAAVGPTGATGADGFSNGFRYLFSTSTTDARPGSGFLRYNSATTSSVSMIYIDNFDVVVGNRTSWYDTFDDSTNGNKGYLYLQYSNGGGHCFAITGAVTVATNYYKIPVSYVNGGAVPAANTTMFVLYSRTGDLGATGAAGATGATGAAATVAVGTVTTGAAGTSAAVTNSGTSSAAVLNFTIPQGATGATGATGAAGTLSLINTATYATPGTTTWTRPAGAVMVEVTVIGGGGGGAAGAASQGTAGGGAGGGGAGAVVQGVFSAATVGGSVSVTVGAGGTGAAAVSRTGTGTNGVAIGVIGSNGGASSFGTLLSAKGGQAGDYASTNSAVSAGGFGATLTGGSLPIEIGGDGGEGAATDNNPASVAAVATSTVPAGGGYGGAPYTTATMDGGAGGTSGSVTGAAGGTAGSINGAAGVTGSSWLASGGGGGFSAYAAAGNVTGGNGGNGIRGSGGGGGGGARSVNTAGVVATSGKGGNGGDGYVVVYTYG